MGIVNNRGQWCDQAAKGAADHCGSHRHLGYRVGKSCLGNSAIQTPASDVEQFWSDGVEKGDVTPQRCQQACWTHESPPVGVPRGTKRKVHFHLQVVIKRVILASDPVRLSISCTNQADRCWHPQRSRIDYPPVFAPS